MWDRQPRVHLHSREAQVGKPFVDKIRGRTRARHGETALQALRITHIPGVTNTLPDVLSRLGAPGARVQELLESMAKATHVQIIRDASCGKSDIAQLNVVVVGKPKTLTGPLRHPLKVQFSKFNPSLNRKKIKWVVWQL